MYQGDICQKKEYFEKIGCNFPSLHNIRIKEKFWEFDGFPLQNYVDL